MGPEDSRRPRSDSIPAASLNSPGARPSGLRGRIRRRERIAYGPSWSSDGSRIVFNAQGQTIDNTVAYIDTTSLDPFEWSDPKDLEVIPGEGLAFESNPSGERVLIARALGTARRREPVIVTINWFDELRAKVPPIQ